MRSRRVAVVAILGLGLLAASGCGGANQRAAGADTPAAASSATGADPATPAEGGTLTVFAAASLGGSFDELGRLYSEQNPGWTVRLSYDGSSALVDQLAQGAPADVLATADPTTMAKAKAKGLLAAEPTTFATNRLVLVVPRGNPGKVTGLDASLTGRKLVICQPQVPCGAATAALAKRAKVTLAPVSEESKVTDVRGKVESGEADAGLVYTTDARASGDKVEVIDVPQAAAVVNSYPIAELTTTRNGIAGAEFIALVGSPQGRAVLQRHGFGAP